MDWKSAFFFSVDTTVFWLGEHQFIASGLRLCPKFPALSVVLNAHRSIFGTGVFFAQRPIVVIVVLDPLTLPHVRNIRPFSASVDEGSHPGHYMGTRNLWQALHVETVMMLTTLFLIGRRLSFLDLGTPRTGVDDTLQKPLNRRRRTSLISITLSNPIGGSSSVRDEESAVGGHRSQDDANLRADDEEVGLPHGVYRAGAFDACNARDCDQDDHGREAEGEHEGDFLGSSDLDFIDEVDGDVEDL